MMRLSHCWLLQANAGENHSLNRQRSVVCSHFTDGDLVKGDVKALVHVYAASNGTQIS